MDPLDNAVIVEMLLQSDGIEVNEGDEDGQTPLHVAAYKGRVFSFAILLGSKVVFPHAMIVMKVD